MATFSLFCPFSVSVRFLHFFLFLGFLGLGGGSHISILYRGVFGHLLANSLRETRAPTGSLCSQIHRKI